MSTVKDISLVSLPINSPSLSVADLCQYINTKMFRPDHAPLYIYVDNELIVSKDSTLAELYQEYRTDDYFLYLSYSEENAYSTDRE